MNARYSPSNLRIASQYSRPCSRHHLLRSRYAVAKSKRVSSDKSMLSHRSTFSPFGHPQDFRTSSLLNCLKNRSEANNSPCSVFAASLEDILTGLPAQTSFCRSVRPFFLLRLAFDTSFLRGLVVIGFQSIRVSRTTTFLPRVVLSAWQFGHP